MCVWGGGGHMTEGKGDRSSFTPTKTWVGGKKFEEVLK